MGGQFLKTSSSLPLACHPRNVSGFLFISLTRRKYLCFRGYSFPFIFLFPFIVELVSFFKTQIKSNHVTFKSSAFNGTTVYTSTDLALSSGSLMIWPLVTSPAYSPDPTVPLHFCLSLLALRMNPAPVTLLSLLPLYGTF